MSSRNHRRRLQEKKQPHRKTTLSHGKATRIEYSDTDAPVLELNEKFKVELKNDKVQSFNTRWDETSIAMKKQPDYEMLDHCFIVSSDSKNI